LFVIQNGTYKKIFFSSPVVIHVIGDGRKKQLVLFADVGQFGEFFWFGELVHPRHKMEEGDHLEHGFGGGKESSSSEHGT